MRSVLVFLLLVGTLSCRNNHQEETRPAYFDIASYFKNEGIRLTKEKSIVHKTVVVNGKSEQKDIVIDDWEKEFKVFIAADINKLAWRGFFAHSHHTDEEIYIANDKKIPVKKVVVGKNGGKITYIQIFIHDSNDLYNSQDSLSYFPDSLYHLKKIQRIKLLAEKKYEVIGRF